MALGPRVPTPSANLAGTASELVGHGDDMEVQEADFGGSAEDDAPSSTAQGSEPGVNVVYDAKKKAKKMAKAPSVRSTDEDAPGSVAQGSEPSVRVVYDDKLTVPLPKFKALPRAAKSKPEAKA